MKKWLCTLSICTVAGLGVLGFAGCSNGEEVSSIRIKTMPETSFAVGDIVTPTLKDGVFTIQYSSGRTSDLPLSAADIVYVDYNDGLTGNQFTQANRAQIVVVRYKGKTTTYNVNVAKSDLVLDYQKKYTTVYDGMEQRIDGALSIVLPAGVNIVKIEYKLKDSREEYSTTPPTKAGTYSVQLTINGGATYFDTVINDIEYVIQKADIDFALEKSVQFGDIIMQYNQKIDPSKNWNVGGQGIPNLFVNALKSQYQQAIPQIKYAYRSENAGEGVGFTDLEKVNENWSLENLEPGAYKLRAYCTGVADFADFYYECNLDITARALVYGEDYEIQISQGATVLCSDVETASLTNIQTQIQTDDPSKLKVEVVFKNPVVQNKLQGNVIVYLNHSEHKVANWGGEGVTQITKYGDYKITISATFDRNVCYFDNTPLGIYICEPATPETDE